MNIQDFLEYMLKSYKCGPHASKSCLFMCTTLKQGRNMVYGLRAQSPKYDWDQGSEQRAQGSEEWDQGSQGF